MIDLLQNMPVEALAALGLVAGVMTFREALKMAMIVGAASRGRPITFYPSYWTHLAATAALVTLFVTAVAVR